MKELSIEEKAKRYDEAIERARKEYKTNEAFKGFCEMLVHIFPKLAVSEDEKIRKAIGYAIGQSTHSDGTLINGVSSEEALDWLEKQGEQNNNEDANILYRFSFYSYKDEPNVIYLSGFYVNEEYRNKGIGTKILEVADEVTKSLDCHAIRLKTKKDSDAERLYQTHGYNSLSTEGKDEIWLEKQAEQKLAVETKLKIEKGKWYICISQFCNCIEGRAYKATSDSRLMDDFGTEYDMHSDAYKHFRLWTIQDARDGDVLAASDGSIFLFKVAIDCACKHYVALTTDYVVKFNEGLEHYWEASTAVHPATKEQRDLLFQKMIEAGYVWDAEKKELKKL